MRWAVDAAVLVGTVVAMEVAASGVHRFVMHGFGWGWHRSHHEPRTGRFEVNDLYAAVFAAPALALFLVAPHFGVLYSVACGVTAYGMLYAVFHDGLVHRRWPAPAAPRNRYLRRLIQAHRLHHATRTRTGAVSFGFLYAPTVPRLVRELRRRRGVAR